MPFPLPIIPNPPFTPDADLVRYLDEAVLPPIPYDSSLSLPLPDHKSHRLHLHVPYHTARSLRVIRKLPPISYNILKQWLILYIPTSGYWTPIEVHPKGESFNVPSPSFKIPDSTIHSHPVNIHTVIQFILFYPLNTTAYILRSLFPTRVPSNWAFHEATTPEARDRESFRYFTWSQSPEGDDPRLIVFCLPPWIISEVDMKRFASYQKEWKSQPAPFSRPESTWILWAKIYNVCARTGVHHFALTSYDHWVFGGFTSEYSAGFSSPVYGRKSHILGRLLHWLSTALDLIKGVNHTAPVSANALVPRGAPSEQGSVIDYSDTQSVSIWGNRDDDGETSAHASEDLPYRPDDDDAPDLHRRKYQRFLLDERIRRVREYQRQQWEWKKKHSERGSLPAVAMPIGTASPPIPQAEGADSVKASTFSHDSEHGEEEKEEEEEAGMNEDPDSDCLSSSSSDGTARWHQSDSDEGFPMDIDDDHGNLMPQLSGQFGTWIVENNIPSAGPLIEF